MGIIPVSEVTVAPGYFLKAINRPMQTIDTVTKNFKAGDRVALGDISKSVQGTIMEVFPGSAGNVYKVRWDNYRIGFCSTEDLTILEN